MTLPPWTTSERRRIRVGEVTRFVRVSDTRGRRTRSRRLPGLHMHRDVAACRIADGQASVGASALERNPGRLGHAVDLCSYGTNAVKSTDAAAATALPGDAAARHRRAPALAKRSPWLQAREQPRRRPRGVGFGTTELGWPRLRRHAAGRVLSCLGHGGARTCFAADPSVRTGRNGRVLPPRSDSEGPSAGRSVSTERSIWSPRQRRILRAAKRS